MHMVDLLPPEDSENSGVSSDKGKGSQRRSQAVIKRSMRKVATTHSQDDFVIPPRQMKKHTSPKVSKKGCRWRKKLVRRWLFPRPRVRRRLVDPFSNFLSISAIV
jgi:hypothetical protein